MMKTSQIYLDFAATTPLSNKVRVKMEPYFSEDYGNPSSIHFWGQKAETIIEESRQRIAELLNAKSREIIFTSGGTESDNLAIRGSAFAMRKAHNANHILISPVEHHAVSQTAKQLGDWFNFEIELLPVDQYGMVDPDTVREKIRPNTALVSVIYANNELGTINPINEIGKICSDHEIPFHSDGVQAAAHIKMDMNRDHLDLFSIGSHKFYGPKGTGVLFVRAETPIIPVQTGGKQEGGLRAGTQNVPYIVGLTEAFEITQNELQKFHKHLVPLRDRIINRIVEEIPDTRLTGHPKNRLPNHASFAFRNIDGNELLMALGQAGFACSSGSACKVGNPDPSDILLAIGFPPDWALGSLRVTLGRETSLNQIDLFLDVLPGIIRKLRSL
jgi:cysteine desulfurase